MFPYLTSLLQPFLLHPDSLDIIRTIDERGVLYTIKPHKEDMGAIIGFKGETIKAIRHIIHVLGRKHDEFISIKVFDPLTTDKEISA